MEAIISVRFQLTKSLVNAVHLSWPYKASAHQAVKAVLISHVGLTLDKEILQTALKYTRVTKCLLLVDDLYCN